MAPKIVLLTTIVLLLTFVVVKFGDTGMCSATWYGSPNGDGSDGEFPMIYNGITPNVNFFADMRLTD